ncbi:MAG: CPBP family intramembrane metalloprotease [Anaerolineales bacterium]|jgi:membrane protease YdiL (CAAX protease family)
MKEISNRKLTYFFIFTFAFSWILWLPQVLKFNGFLGLPDIVGLPGMFAPFGPAVAAFFLVWRDDGKEGVKVLWKRGWQQNFRKVWLLPTLLLGPVTALLTVFILIVVQGSFSCEYGIPVVMVIPVFLLIYFTNALPEEYGWRGFALDPLQKRTSALGASLVLGLIWAIWHLPLFFIEGTTQAAIPMYQYFLQTIVLSIFYTWLHNNTGGSVFIAIVFHSISNISAAVVPFWTTELGRWIDFGLLVIAATVVLFIWGRKRLSKT